MLLILSGSVAPIVAAAQDSTDIGVSLPAAKPYSIKWWGVGAVIGAGLLTMAVVDEPVQQWATNPANHSSTANEIASILVNRRIGDVSNVGERRQRLTGGFLIAQVHRNEPEILSTRQFRFAPGNTDNIPACSEE